MILKLNRVQIMALWAIAVNTPLDSEFEVLSIDAEGDVIVSGKAPESYMGECRWKLFSAGGSETLSPERPMPPLDSADEEPSLDIV